MLETVFNSIFQSIDLTKLNQHKEMSYDSTEVTVRTLDHFLKNVINTIFNFSDVTAYYRAVTQQKHLSEKLAL